MIHFSLEGLSQSVITTFINQFGQLGLWQIWDYMQEQSYSITSSTFHHIHQATPLTIERRHLFVFGEGELLMLLDVFVYLQHILGIYDAITIHIL